MNRRGLLALVCASLAVPGAAVAADPATALDGYLTGLSTWSADFTQQVEDSRRRQLEGGRGRLIIVRPGKFRWEYAPEGADDGAQLMLADGRNLWFLDRDLAQAQVKPLQEAMPQSPFMLLAGGSDLRAAFSVQANGRRDGLEWVRVLPRDAQSDFREALFGFQGRELARIVVVDKVGQRSTLRFTGVKRNATVDPTLIRFELPAGVDLLGKPVAP